jgi:hypothetical protein
MSSSSTRPKRNPRTPAATPRRPRVSVYGLAQDEDTNLDTVEAAEKQDKPQYEDAPHQVCQ